MIWQKLKTESQKVGYKTIVAKTFKMPDGQITDYTTIGVENTHVAAVIAITSENKVVIGRQFRAGPEKEFDEIPGGGVEPGEEPEAAAARELLEETGYISADPYMYLGPANRDAYVNETSHYFLARNCKLVGEQALDEHEHIEPAEITITQLIDNAKHAKMTDAVAVLMAYDELMLIQKEVL